MLRIIKGLLSYKGRLSRKDFVKIHIVLLILFWPLYILYNKGHIRGDAPEMVLAAIFFVLWIISVFACTKRMQDFDYPGYWSVVGYMTCLVVSQYFGGFRAMWIMLAFAATVKPTPGENRYGDNPLGNKEDTVIQKRIFKSNKTKGQSSNESVDNISEEDIVESIESKK